MDVTIEISMYPLDVNFRELVQGFIAKLETYENVRVSPGPTSTVIFGEYQGVMQTLTELLAWSHKEHGQAVFVTKFILDYEAG